MAEALVDWQSIAEKEIALRESAHHSLEEMRKFLFNYFYLLGPNPIANMSVVVDTLGKVLGSTVAIYNRLDSGILKAWCIDHKPEGFKSEDNPEGHICYEMTIRGCDPVNIKPVVLSDLEGSEWEDLDANVRAYGLKSYLGFPVVIEGKAVGSLCIVSTERRAFSKIEQYIIGAFASAIRLEEERLLTQNRLAEANLDLAKKNEEIEQLALTDQLTGLANRRAIIEQIRAEILAFFRRAYQVEDVSNITGFSILLCDLDHFKAVNDTYGHNCGDEVLRAVANVFQGGLRHSDKIARWGGEEFLILLPETDAAQAVEVAERVREKVANMVVSYNGIPLHVTISLGVTTCKQVDLDLEECINLADKALYQGKHKGRNRVEFISASDLSD